MRHVQPRHAVRAKSWAVLTLAISVTAGSAIAIANAQGGAHNVRPDKVKNCSGSGACVGGNNAGNGAGVAGTAALYYGVIGQANGTDAGVGGFNSASGFGASGVYGQSANGYGVYGVTQTSAGYGLVSQGNAFVSGEIYTGGACHEGCIGGRHQTSFGARSTAPTIDDVGEGMLHGGAARIALAADFANAIDSTKPYLVMLTPEGDAALYVADRSATAFDVRQVGGGRSSFAFVYRIVAKPFGVADERLPFKMVASPAGLTVPRAGQ